MPNAVKNALWTWFACIIMWFGTILFAYAVVSIMI